VFSAEDKLRGRLIEALMCDFRVNTAEILSKFDISADRLDAMYIETMAQFPGFLRKTDEGLFIPADAQPLTRMIARSFDAYDLSKAGHSSAI